MLSVLTGDAVSPFPGLRWPNPTVQTSSPEGAPPSHPRGCGPQGSQPHAQTPLPGADSQVPGLVGGNGEALGPWGDEGGVARGASTPVSASSQNPRAQLSLPAPLVFGRSWGPSRPLRRHHLQRGAQRSPAGDRRGQGAPRPCAQTDTGPPWPQQAAPTQCGRATVTTAGAASAPRAGSRGTLAEAGEDAPAGRLLAPACPARGGQKATRGRRPAC